jgi:hypothetical protein
MKLLQHISLAVVSKDAEHSSSAAQCSYIFPANYQKVGELTSGLEPLICSLGVCGQWLLSVAQDRKTRINKGFSVPSIAHYCRSLRPG